MIKLVVVMVAEREVKVIIFIVKVKGILFIMAINFRSMVIIFVMAIIIHTQQYESLIL